MNINYEFDTICAIATPIGVGGVGIVRISGSKAFDVAAKIFSNKKIEIEKINYGWIFEDTNKLDEVILLAFKAPKSFTGEDVIEIQCHGGINVYKKILELAVKNGCRPAAKGEFTKRAFLNNKIDLSKAEAILDLIHAKTTEFVKKSAQNLSGMLEIKTKELRTQVLDLLSKIVAAIDFPEDVPEPEYSYIEEKILVLKSDINKILSGAQSSNVMREGIRAVIAGCPNVGKSSLFNTLLNLERAIVTEIPGTTRDIIHETIDIDGVPVTLLDTAGIRQDETLDKVESIGIDYSLQSLNEADLVIFVFSAESGMTDSDKKIFELIKDKTFIHVASKADLIEPATLKKPDVVYVSSLSGENIDVLKEKIKQKVLSQNLTETDFVTNQRQQECLSRADEALNNALTALREKELQDLISIDIKSALLFLDEISGEVITDEILDSIFDNFCIGK